MNDFVIRIKKKIKIKRNKKEKKNEKSNCIW